MNCKTSKEINLNTLLKKTHLSLTQITSFYSYYKKCITLDSEYMTYEEFKISLGILGSKAGDFISKRLFNVIIDPKSKTLSFERYIMFLDLVDNGSKAEKLSHCFKLFDENNKGYINSHDFVNFVYNLCQYVSTITVTQINITKEDLYKLYYSSLQKEGFNQHLTLEKFIQIIDSSPQFLDFYDIFNNKIKGEFEIRIKKDQFDKLNSIASLIEMFQTRIKNSQYRPSSISLVNDDYIDDVIELRKANVKLNEQIANSNSNNNIGNADRSQMKKPRGGNKNKLTQPLKLQCALDSDHSILDTISNQNSSFENDSNSPSHQSILSGDSQLNREVENLVSQIDLKTNTFRKGQLDQIEDKSNNNSNPLSNEYDFQILKPFTDINDPQLKECLSKESIDLNNSLIIANKHSLITFITELHKTLTQLINEINPNKARQSKRGNIWISNNEKKELKVEDILNLSFANNEIEKGMIHFGNSNLELVINLMIGIKHGVSSCDISPSTESGNQPIYYPTSNPEIYTEFNRFQYEQNNFSSVVNCKFYDFAPKIFFNLRRIYNITNEDYLKSLGPENFLGNVITLKNKSLKELCSSGKSGSFFYFSYDSKYLLKTIAEGEFRLFQSMLRDYYEHMSNNEHTLLQRFFGMHIFIYNNVKMFFVVMNNVFITSLKIHYKYDLKGSTYERMARRKDDIDYKEYDYHTALKDNDFTDRKEVIDISEKDKTKIIEEATKDSGLLSRHNINDYSFLIGVHDPSFDNDISLEHTNTFQRKLANPRYSLDDRLSCSQLIDRQIRKPFYESYLGGIKGINSEKVYFFGIIDTFTLYGSKKKMEHFVKTIAQGNGISCQPPIDYSDRFCNFVKTVVLPLSTENGNEYKFSYENNIQKENKPLLFYDNITSNNTLINNEMILLKKKKSSLVSKKAILNQRNRCNSEEIE